MSVVLYGIPNCDTVKKARKWLAENEVDYRFHDFRKNGFDPQMLDSFLTRVSWETLLNRRGMSWRKLDEEQKQDLDQNKARALMLDNPTLIKRPVLQLQDQVHVGFKPEEYEQIGF